MKIINEKQRNERNTQMFKKVVLAIICCLALGLAACGTEDKKESGSPIQGEPIAESTGKAGENAGEEKVAATASDESSVASSEADQATAITEEQALEAIKNYCILQNPQLKEMMESGDQSFYWVSTMNEKGEIVILYRSYTAAQIRYYVDPNTGDTYVTEFVPGITDEEERTEEKFNIKDYL